jgi:hypothetical protein
MTTGIAFGSSKFWLVRSTLAEPVLLRVAKRLADNPTLAEFVEHGIYLGSVGVELLDDPAERERVRQAVVDEVRALLADDALLRSIGPDVPHPDWDENRRATMQRLLDLAESDEVRELTGGGRPSG